MPHRFVTLTLNMCQTTKRSRHFILANVCGKDKGVTDASFWLKDNGFRRIKNGFIKFGKFTQEQAESIFNAWKMFVKEKTISNNIKISFK
jgi:hypothetical protein